MTDSEHMKIFFITDSGECSESDLEEKISLDQLVDQILEEKIHVIAIPTSAFISDKKTEEIFISESGIVKQFGSFKIISVRDVDASEISKMEEFIRKKTGNSMFGIEGILRNLMEISPEYITQFGREDPTMEIIRYLLIIRKERVSTIARKFSIKSEGALSLFYSYGTPFTKLGFENRDDWPIVYDKDTDSLTIQHADVIEKFFRHIRVPDDFEIEILHPRTKEKRTYKGEDLIRISLERTKELADVLHGYFSQIPCDQIGRPCIEIKYLDNGKFLLLGSFWLFSLIIKPGYHTRGKEGLIDERAVNEAFNQLSTRGQDEKFIDDDKTFPLVISSGFTDKAKELAEKLPKPVILFPIEELIRLIYFIEKLDTPRKKELALWALFRLGKIREANPSRRIDRFIDEVNQAVSALEKEVSS